jgi:hypothetical protein
MGKNTDDYIKSMEYKGKNIVLKDDFDRSMTIEIPDRPRKLMQGGHDNQENILGLLNGMDLADVVNKSKNLPSESHQKVVNLAAKLNGVLSDMNPERIKGIVANAQGKGYRPELNYILDAVSENIRTKELVPSIVSHLKQVRSTSQEIYTQSKYVNELTAGKNFISDDEALLISKESVKLGKIVRGR